MSVPTECFLVTSRNDCFCPEKAVGFFLGNRDADKLKESLDKRDQCTYHVVPCIVMPTETFYELCPDWRH